MALPTAACQAESARPNVIFIAIEDFSPKHLGCYGGQAITPHIDALARESVLFKNAFVSSPVCNPSRTALLTGLRPPSSGVYYNENNWKELALPKIPATLPEHFRNNGYLTVVGGKLFHHQMEHPESWSRILPPIEGRKRLSSYSPKVVATLQRLPDHGGRGYFSESLQWGPYDCSPEEFRDGHTTTAARDFLAEAQEQPFFLALGFHAPHLKFAAPKQFFELYDPAAIELPNNPENDLEDIPTIRHKNAIHSVLTEAQWREIKLAQFATMSYVDWCVGQVMDALSKNDLEEKTIIVLWTDHGYLLGEHFQWSKGGSKLFEETNNAAYLWKVPGMTPKNFVTESVVESIDTFPTLFELCGIPVPEHVQGKSFVPLLQDPSMPWKEAAFTWGGSKRVSIQSERYRLNTNIDLNPASFELYDHALDPEEFINRSKDPDYAPVIERLLQLYLDNEATHLNASPSAARK